MGPEFYLSILSGKIAIKATRLFHFGGTSFPGKLALSIHPSLLKELGERLKFKIFITGTNGKTTTARVISGILDRFGIDYVHNRAGANLPRGICTSLIDRFSLRESLDNCIGIFEIDEAYLKILSNEIRPDVIIITNLFRDQLDRYGEVDTLARSFRSIAEDNSETTFILNGDDPLVSSVAYNLSNKVLYFGLEYPGWENFSGIADIRSCPFCDANLVYRKHYIGHQGDFECLNCGFKRVKPDIAAYNIDAGLDSSSFDISFKGLSYRVNVQLPGIYNVYNVLSAILCCNILGLSLETSIRYLEEVKTAFGRGEKIKFKDKTIYILLAKNPAGFNEIIQLLSGKKGIMVVLAINDNIQDGTDISWLWDVNFELLMGSSRYIIVSGRRAYDMGLRLKYGGFDTSRLIIEEDVFDALSLAVDKTGDDTVYVIPTYTAMLELRRKLETLGITKGFWKD
ncbi:MAG TPA: MurT ligase domain-containing protein [bacterium]|nr:MurT ligase domain-containing protein [bacterium]